MTGKDFRTVSIRPGVSILSVLRHLNYRPWFALAEFVDNSLQSYLDYRDKLRKVERKKLKLVVRIERDLEGQITIRDNAAGIHEADYAHAFRPAEIPADRSGLAEFGMGMKSAACWFAPRWRVRTSALGEPIERTVAFDIAKIVRDDLEELDVQTRPAKPNLHFTEIVLLDLHNPPQGRTLSKIKEHLASIYRVFIREKILELWFDGEPLSFQGPKVLKAPYYKPPSKEHLFWRKDINFDFGRGLRAHGFAAIRETASTSHAGFALFRRKRLIQGSADEGYRPEYIFGKPNSYRYQRLFGEMHLEGFEVSHTKDGFKWDESEQAFLEILKDKLDSKPLPLLEQAEAHRVRVGRKELRKAAEVASQKTADVIRREVPPVLEQQLEEAPDNKAAPKNLPQALSASTREIDVELNDKPWRIVIELSNDPAIGDWITVSDKAPKPKSSPRQVMVRMALSHPFIERFAGTDHSQIEPFLRIAAAIGLAEIAARDSGVKAAGTIRRNINDLLRNALSKP